MRQQTNPRPRRGRNSGRRPGPQRNQNFDSNGPSVRVRGNAYQVMEKYLALARDAATTGDRIAAENYYQHAEHYFRILNVNNDANASANGSGRDNPSISNGQHRGRPEESKVEERRADQNKAEDAKPSEAKADEAEAANAMPANAKPNEAKADEAKAASAKLASAKAPNAKPSEAKADEAEAAIVKPTNAKPREAKADEAEAAIAKPTSAKANENKADKGKVKPASAKAAKSEDAGSAGEKSAKGTEPPPAE